MKGKKKGERYEEGRKDKTVAIIHTYRDISHTCIERERERDVYTIKKEIKLSKGYVNKV